MAPNKIAEPPIVLMSTSVSVASPSRPLLNRYNEAICKSAGPRRNAKDIEFLACLRREHCAFVYYM